MSRQLPSDDDVQHQLQTVRAQVMEMVAASSDTRARTIRGLAVAGVAGLLLTGGAYVITASSEEQNSFVRCYGLSSLNSTYADLVNVTYNDDYFANPSSAPDPTESCADLAWAVGQFDPTADPTNIEPIYPVPPLTACRFVNGIAAVFPNEEKISAEKLCGSLGLAVWEPVSGV